MCHHKKLWTYWTHLTLSQWKTELSWAALHKSSLHRHFQGLNPRQTVWWNNIDDREEQQFHRRAWQRHRSSFHITYLQLLPVFPPKYTSLPCHIVFFPYQCQRQITPQPWGQVKLIQSNLSDKMMSEWGSKRNWMGGKKLIGGTQFLFEL